MKVLVYTSPVYLNVCSVVSSTHLQFGTRLILMSKKTFITEQRSCLLICPYNLPIILWSCGIGCDNNIKQQFLN